MTFYPKQLSEDHIRQLEGSGIDPGIAVERGYRTATRRSELLGVFKDYQRRPGLLIPVGSPSGTTGIRLRPDRPRKGKDGTNPAIKPATHERNWRGGEIGRRDLHRPDTYAVCQLSGVS